VGLFYNAHEPTRTFKQNCVTESETDEFNTQRCVQCTTVKFDMAVPAMFSAKHWYDPTLEILAGN